MIKLKKVRGRDEWRTLDGKWQIGYSITPAKYSITGKDEIQGYGIWYLGSFGFPIWLQQQDANGECWYDTFKEAKKALEQIMKGYEK